MKWIARAVGVCFPDMMVALKAVSISKLTVEETFYPEHLPGN
jgi:hypothetical protein